MSQDLKATLLGVAGQHAVLTYHRPFANLVGSIEGALMLSQLLYWHDDRTGEWMPIPDATWMELFGRECLTSYRIRKAAETMEHQGYLDTEVRQHEGAPVQHYRVDMEAFMETWRDHVGSDVDTGTSTEGETDPEGASLDTLLNVPPESVTPTVATEAWNRFANAMREDGYDLSRVRKVTDTRRSKVKTHREQLWPHMREVFDRIKRSAHLRGENGWTVSFDWVWRSESNYTKVLEGVYEDEGDSGRAREADENTSGSDVHDGVGFASGE
jgi:hypothetical protein